LSVDFEAVYDRPVAERTQAFLEASVDIRTIAEEVSTPRWSTEAYVEPTPERVPVLPFLVRDLALIRSADEAPIKRRPDLEAVRNELSLSGTPNTNRPPQTCGVTPRTDRSIRGRRPSKSNAKAGKGAARFASPIVSLPDTEAVTPVWVGEGIAHRANNATADAYHHRLARQAYDSTEQISVDVVVNDEEMSEEAAVSELYGDREALPFKVAVHGQQTQDGLAGLFEQETDFFHYIGHADSAGFRCTDGHLDAAELEDVGPAMFLLTACGSYEQGQRLIARGAVSGRVPLSDVLSPFATRIGKTVAELLNAGFPMDAATRLIRSVMAAGQHYGMVGDPKATVVQPELGATEISFFSLLDDGRIRVESECVTTPGYGIGSCWTVFFDTDHTSVTPSRVRLGTIEDNDVLNDYLHAEQKAVPIGGEIYWSNDLSASELRERLQAASSSSLR
jgi:hypothetical protein